MSCESSSTVELDSSGSANAYEIPPNAATMETVLRGCTEIGIFTAKRNFSDTFKHLETKYQAEFLRWIQEEYMRSGPVQQSFDRMQLASLEQSSAVDGQCTILFLLRMSTNFLIVNDYVLEDSLTLSPQNL